MEVTATSFHPLVAVAIADEASNDPGLFELSEYIATATRPPLEGKLTPIVCSEPDWEAVIEKANAQAT